MTARAFGLNLKWGAALLAIWIGAACASVLGIEERKLDTRETYPEEGYDGCRPGGSCGACLEVHQAACEIRGACTDTSSLGACGECVCGSCIEPLISCRADEGCSAIWQCIEQTRCDLSESAAGSCAAACRSVIQERGGVAGAAFQAAVAIRACAAASSCFSCLPTTSEPAEQCRPQDGCQGCPDCFRGCLCSGEKWSACRDQCGESQAPPESCSPGSCGGCDSCLLNCACNGQTYESCDAICQSPSCTLATGCDDCVDCVAECVCEGGDQASCEASCGSTPPAGSCREQSGSSGAGSEEADCDGCTSCLADCTCQGTPLERCMRDCDLLDCCTDGSGCSGPTTSCVCSETQSADDCAVQHYGSCDNVAGDCNGCACSNCPGKYALCLETSGCLPIFECMRSSGCDGGACAESCGGGSGLGAFAAAEALWACAQGASCDCSEPSPPQVYCGSALCDPFVGADATFAACCPDSGGSEPAAPAQGEERCGLNLSRHYSTAPSCLPLGEQRPPPNLFCSNARIEGPVYKGATLQGCCRAADDVCGYWDDITGLGCLHPSTFSADATVVRGCL